MPFHTKYKFLDMIVYSFPCLVFLWNAIDGSNLDMLI